MAHHPDFIKFAEASRAGNFTEALALVDALIAAFPTQPALHWHRVATLEKLGRFDEIGAAVEQLLALAPDHVPAIVKRVQLRLAEADEDFDDEESLKPKEVERRDQLRARRNLELSQAAEAELRRALNLEPDHVEALRLLSAVLRNREGANADSSEANVLLNRAIELEPESVELLLTRSDVRRSEAFLAIDGPIDADTIVSFSGIRFSRSMLEAAVADLERVLRISDEDRHLLRLAGLLHDLGRHDEALARYDTVLARLPADDFRREHIVAMRERSENNGAGEREQMARMLESSLLGDGKDRNLADDMGAQAILGAARAVRSGKSVQEALEHRLSEDPDTLMASNIAQQILNVAHEAPPELEAVDPAGYPAYQRRFADAVAREVAPLGLAHVADGEAKGLFPSLGQHVLIRFFADPSGKVGVAAFALKPKWPGLVGFLILLLTGKWKVASMVECITHFDDGTLLSTQHDNPSPFGYGPPVFIERMPRSTSVAALSARHIARVQEHQAAHPDAEPLVSLDLAGMDLRWREGQRVKGDYRRSIGYATDAELKALLGGHYDRFATKVRTQINLLSQDYNAQEAA